MELHTEIKVGNLILVEESVSNEENGTWVGYVLNIDHDRIDILWDDGNRVKDSLQEIEIALQEPFWTLIQ